MIKPLKKILKGDVGIAGGYLSWCKSQLFLLERLRFDKNQRMDRRFYIHDTQTSIHIQSMPLFDSITIDTQLASPAKFFVSRFSLGVVEVYSKAGDYIGDLVLPDTINLTDNFAGMTQVGNKIYGVNDNTGVLTPKAQAYRADIPKLKIETAYQLYSQPTLSTITGFVDIDYNEVRQEFLLSINTNIASQAPLYILDSNLVYASIKSFSSTFHVASSSSYAGASTYISYHDKVGLLSVEAGILKVNSSTYATQDTGYIYPDGLLNYPIINQIDTGPTKVYCSGCTPFADDLGTWKERHDVQQQMAMFDKDDLSLYTLHDLHAISSLPKADYTYTDPDFTQPNIYNIPYLFQQQQVLVDEEEQGVWVSFGPSRNSGLIVPDATDSYLILFNYDLTAEKKKIKLKYHPNPTNEYLWGTPYGFLII